MVVETAESAVKVFSWPNEEKPFGCGCGCFVAEIEHGDHYDNKATDDCLCHLVVLDKFADDCPYKNTNGIEMQYTKGHKQ